MKTRKREPCDFCYGTLGPRNVTVDWRRAGRLMVIENVPALVRDRCGERYYSASAMREMEGMAKSNRGAKRTIKVPVARFEVVA